MKFLIIHNNQKKYNFLLMILIFMYLCSCSNSDSNQLQESERGNEMIYADTVNVNGNKIYANMTTYDEDCFKFEARFGFYYIINIELLHGNLDLVCDFNEISVRNRGRTLNLKGIGEDEMYAFHLEYPDSWQLATKEDKFSCYIRIYHNSDAPTYKAKGKYALSVLEVEENDE